MAYSLRERFPSPPKYYKISDPGAYQYVGGYKYKLNKVPFLSKTPRITQPGGKLWTHKIYEVDIRPKIPNITSLKTKCPRFPYEAFSKEDLERILCQCGIQTECECPVEEEEQKFVCQAQIPRCLYKGPPPRSMVLGDSGLSAPSRNDHGFDVSKNGFQKRKMCKVSDDSPPFYDATFNEFTKFYHGWKWSKRTSKRFKSSIIRSPGPADYTIVPEPTLEQICYDKNRHLKRKASKQLRFIEIIQNINIKEGRPGPATYSPKIPKWFSPDYYGLKAERFFTSIFDISPGSADYTLKSSFDKAEPPEIPCHAKLPEPACFGVKAQRFKPRNEEGPSPASYNVKFKPCLFVHCPTAPFGSSSVRFKEEILLDNEDEMEEDEIENEPGNDEDLTVKCPMPTWQFKSKTIRMKPLIKKFDEPSPADLPQPSNKIERSPELQYKAPFYSSEGRFVPWNDWMPVFGKIQTPGPAYYCLEKPEYLPPVNQSTLSRSPRFPFSSRKTPAPNEYDVGGGIETVLSTHNRRLKDNIEKQRKFHWEPPKEPRQLSYEERESGLWQKCIMILDEDYPAEKPESTTKPSSPPPPSHPSSPSPPSTMKSKFLRCFL